MLSTYQLKIFADYFQFIVMDENSGDDLSLIWNDEAVEQLLAVGKQAICPGTLRNADVEVAIRIADSAPQIDLAQYDHAVEASFDIPSGKLVIMGCTDYQPASPRIELPAGPYQVLFLVSGIETIKTEWEPANDQYVVYAWQGEHRPTRIIKHWKPNLA